MGVSVVWMVVASRLGLIWCRGVLVGTRRVDFLVEVVLVELKAVVGLDDLPMAQGLNYLEAFGLDVVLLNFEATRLEFKRLMKGV